MFHQVEQVLEADLVDSAEASLYFSDPKNVPEQTLKAVALEELRKYGDNIDKEGIIICSTINSPY